MMTVNQVSPREAGWNGYVGRIANGDELALESLMRESQSLVMGIAKRVLACPGDEDEVVSDVFMQVWRSADTFDPDRGSAAAWVSRIAKTRAIDHRRRERRRSELTGQELNDSVRHDSSPRGHSDSSHARMVLNRALRHLPGEQSKLVQLAFLNGFSHSEIARRLNLPLGTVKFRIRLGMGKLRGAIGETRGR